VRETLHDKTPVRSSAAPQADDTPAGAQLPAPADDAGLRAANTYAVFGVKRLWSFVAALCLVAAVVLGWRGHLDATFITAAVGLLAWFLDQRNLIRARHIETPADDIEENEGDDEQ